MSPDNLCHNIPYFFWSPPRVSSQSYHPGLIIRVSSQSHHSGLLSVSSLVSPLSLITRISSQSLIRPRTHFHSLTLTHHDITSPRARGWILSQFLSNSRYLLYLTNPQWDWELEDFWAVVKSVENLVGGCRLLRGAVLLEVVKQQTCNLGKNWN